MDSIINNLFLFLALTLLVLPGLLLTHLIWKSRSIIERIYFGTVISFSISIFVGFIFSFFKVFNLLAVISYILVFIVVSSFLFFYKREKRPKKLKLSKENIYISLFIIILSLSLFILHYQYENVNQSPFPVGWDRGNHLARTTYLINKEHLWHHHLGTPYKAFYPQGMYLLFGMFSFISSLFHRVSFLNINYSSLAELSKFVSFFFGIVVAMIPLAIYSVVKNFYKNRKLCLLALVSFVPFSASFILAGTIGSNLGILMAGLPLILSLDFIRERKQNGTKYILFILILASIFLIHPQPTIFAFSIPIFIFLIAFIKKDINLKKGGKLVMLVILALFLSISYLLIFNRDLLFGIFDEMRRKLTPQATFFFKPSSVSNLSFTESSMTNIYSILTSNLFFLVLLLIGFTSCLKQKRIYTLTIVGGAFSLCFFPLFPLTRPLYYLLYPLLIIYALGINTLIGLFRDKKKQIFALIVIIFILIGGIVKTTKASVNPQHWIANKRVYSNAIKLSNWISQNLDTSIILACPAAGPPERLLEALTENKYYFSDPRYPDIPSYREIALIYHPETKVTKKIEIIKRYKIDAIISVGYQEISIDELRLFYPDLEVHDVNNIYNIALLDIK